MMRIKFIRENTLKELEVANKVLVERCRPTITEMGRKMAELLGRS